MRRGRGLWLDEPEHTEFGGSIYGLAIDGEGVAVSEPKSGEAQAIRLRRIRNDCIAAPAREDHPPPVEAPSHEDIDIFNRL